MLRRDIHRSILSSALEKALSKMKFSLLCNISYCLFVFMLKAHKGVKNAFDTGIVLPGIQNM